MKIRTWTMAAAIALLASADWFAADAPAGGEAGGASLKIGEATVTAELREVKKEGKTETHAFLKVDGSGAGTITVRLQETKFRPEARMLPRPVTAWSKEIAFDSTKAASVDIGAVPAAAVNVRRVLEASADGKTFVKLLALDGKVLSDLDE